MDFVWNAPWVIVGGLIGVIDMAFLGQLKFSPVTPFAVLLGRCRLRRRGFKKARVARTGREQRLCKNWGLACVV